MMVESYARQLFFRFFYKKNKECGTRVKRLANFCAANFLYLLVPQLLLWTDVYFLYRVLANRVKCSPEKYETSFKRLYMKQGLLGIASGRSRFFFTSKIKKNKNQIIFRARPAFLFFIKKTEKSWRAYDFNHQTHSLYQITKNRYNI